MFKWWVKISKACTAAYAAAQNSLTDKDDETSASDIHGNTIKAIELISYPPVSHGVPVVEAKELLAQHDAVIASTLRLSKLGSIQSKYSFQKLYGEVLENFVAFIHALPASEGHHHSHVGGLLAHSLDVAEKALRWADSNYLIPTHSLDIEQQRKPRWFYAAWLSGLLHDAGKTFTDMVVFDANNRASEWLPVNGPLTTWAKDNNVNRYKVIWRRERIHKQHESAAVHILPFVLSPAAREYIASSPDNLMHEITNALSGYNTNRGYIASAIRHADSISTSNDLQSSWGSQLGKRDASTFELVIKSIQHLHSRWDVNQQSANIWTVGSEDDVYLRWPDAFRETIEHLNQLNVAIPQSADTVISLLMDRGIVQNIIKEEKYVLFMPGNFTHDDVLKIQSGEKTVNWQFVARIAWPSLVYNGAPTPVGQSGIIKLNRDGDMVLYRADGSKEKILATSTNKAEAVMTSQAKPVTTKTTKPTTSGKKTSLKKSKTDQKDNSTPPDIEPDRKKLSKAGSTILNFNAKDVASMHSKSKQPAAKKSKLKAKQKQPSKSEGVAGTGNSAQGQGSAATPDAKPVTAAGTGNSAQGQGSAATPDAKPVTAAGTGNSAQGQGSAATPDAKPVTAAGTGNSTQGQGSAATPDAKPVTAAGTGNSAQGQGSAATPDAKIYPWLSKDKKPTEIDNQLFMVLQQLSDSNDPKLKSTFIALDNKTVIVKPRLLAEFIGFSSDKELVAALKSHGYLVVDPKKPMMVIDNYQLNRSTTINAIKLNQRLSSEFLSQCKWLQVRKPRKRTAKKPSQANFSEKHLRDFLSDQRDNLLKQKILIPRENEVVLYAITFIDQIVKAHSCSEADVEAVLAKVKAKKELLPASDGDTELYYVLRSDA